MDQIQVNVLQTKLIDIRLVCHPLAAQVAHEREAIHDRIFDIFLPRKLGRDKDLVSIETTIADGFTNFDLVPVRLGGV